MTEKPTETDPDTIHAIRKARIEGFADGWIHRDRFAPSPPPPGMMDPREIARFNMPTFYPAKIVIRND